MIASTLRAHWPEYVSEMACLGVFMISAVLFATLLQHPASPWWQGLESSIVVRIPMGVAMGLTAVAIIYSPVGRRSGAHMNPAVTLAFLRLGKVTTIDAAGYIAAQFAGGFAGLTATIALLANLPADPSVNYVATRPGPAGAAVAFAAELAISFAMMLMVLRLSNHARLSRFTGLGAGLLVFVFITVEAPLSGMSMNPARSFAPAILAHALDSFWIYLAAPLAGMLLAAEIHVRRYGPAGVACAKLDHPSDTHCIFCGGSR